MAPPLQIGTRVSFEFAGGTGKGEVISSPTSTHALVAVDPDIGVPGPHRVVLWCELASLVLISPTKPVPEEKKP